MRIQNLFHVVLMEEIENNNKVSAEYSSTRLIPNKHVNKEPKTSLSLAYRTSVMLSFHKFKSVRASVLIL